MEGCFARFEYLVPSSAELQELTSGKQQARA
jgi:hypothetical protein